MFCRNCGKETTQRTPFCTECGAPLSWTEEPQTDILPQQPPAAPQPPVSEPPVFEQKPVYEAPVAPAPVAPQLKKKGKGGMIALIIIAAVLLVSLIGVGIYCILLNVQCSSLSDVIHNQNEEIEDCNSELSDLTDEYNVLVDEYNALSDDYDVLCDDYDALYEDFLYSSEYDDALLEEYWFFRDHAVFCSDDNNYYHSYECPDWDRDSFWIFNSEYAIYQEYESCPNCQ